MSSDASTRLTRSELEREAARLREHLPATPLLHSPLLSRLTERDVWLKLETQQPTGSFKVRPALTGALQHGKQARARGLIASSSGNFAQGVAWAAARIDARATIVMTEDTAPYKIERTRALGARIELCGPRFEDRWATVKRIQDAEGQIDLHPFNSEETLLGDATLVPEVLSQLSASIAQGCTFLVPASGGGLSAGIAWGAHAIAAERELRVVAVQPASGGALARSLEAGKIVNVGKVHTWADALVASEPGSRTLELFARHGSGVRLLSEEAIREATLLMIEEHKLWVEPAAALPVALLLEQARAQSEPLPGRSFVCVVTGANLAPTRLADLLAGNE